MASHLVAFFTTIKNKVGQGGRVAPTCRAVALAKAGAFSEGGHSLPASPVEGWIYDRRFPFGKNIRKDP